MTLVNKTYWVIISLFLPVIRTLTYLQDAKPGKVAADIPYLKINLQKHWLLQFVSYSDQIPHLYDFEY